MVSNNVGTVLRSETTYLFSKKHFYRIVYTVTEKKNYSFQIWSWFQYLTRWRAAFQSSDSCVGQPAVSGVVDKPP
jgi:hypothetical protein